MRVLEPSGKEATALAILPLPFDQGSDWIREADFDSVSEIEMRLRAMSSRVVRGKARALLFSREGCAVVDAHAPSPVVVLAALAHIEVQWDDTTLADAPLSLHVADSDPLGVFHVGHEPSGPARIAVPPGHVRPRAEVLPVFWLEGLHLGAGETAVIRLHSNTQMLAVEVVDASGAPVPGAHVLVEEIGATDAMAVSHATTSTEGLAHFRLRRTSRHTIVVTHEDLRLAAAVRVGVDSGERRTVRVVLQPTARVRFELEGPLPTDSHVECHVVAQLSDIELLSFRIDNHASLAEAFLPEGDYVLVARGYGVFLPDAVICFDAPAAVQEKRVEIPTPTTLRNLDVRFYSRTRGLSWTLHFTSTVDGTLFRMSKRLSDGTLHVQVPTSAVRVGAGWRWHERMGSSGEVAVAPGTEGVVLHLDDRVHECYLGAGSVGLQQARVRSKTAMGVPLDLIWLPGSRRAICLSEVPLRVGPLASADRTGGHWVLEQVATRRYVLRGEATAASSTTPPPAMYEIEVRIRGAEGVPGRAVVHLADGHEVEARFDRRGLCHVMGAAEPLSLEVVSLANEASVVRRVRVEHGPHQTYVARCRLRLEPWSEWPSSVRSQYLRGVRTAAGGNALEMLIRLQYEGRRDCEGPAVQVVSEWGPGAYVGTCDLIPFAMTIEPDDP